MEENTLESMFTSEEELEAQRRKRVYNQTRKRTARLTTNTPQLTLTDYKPQYLPRRYLHEAK